MTRQAGSTRTLRIGLAVWIAASACASEPGAPPATGGSSGTGGAAGRGSGGTSGSGTAGSSGAGTAGVAPGGGSGSSGGSAGAGLAGGASGGKPAGGSAMGGSSAGTVGSAGAASGSGGSAGGGRSNGGRNGMGGSAGASDTAGAGGRSGGAGTSGSAGAGGMAASAPCDIYATGGTPCVAAHSTVRALYAAYGTNLYQVRRASDKTTKDIPVLTAGGFADAAVQDTFCANTTCTISIIYDQSPKLNHLKVGPAGGAGKADVEADATALKLNVGGHSVYGVFIAPGMGYRDNETSGIATGDEPEGMYMVTSGKHYNSGCCFDYGNAETNNLDTGNGHMEAIYFGNCTGWGKGSANGPWVMADLENGLFAGQSLDRADANTPLSSDYVTAAVKGKPGTFAIRGGNAQSGTLKTMYDGARPTTQGYNPMHKEGAIILGIGGDNSNASAGSFFEGCMTEGYPSAATEDAIQANIVAAGYGH